MDLRAYVDIEQALWRRLLKEWVGYAATFHADIALLVEAGQFDEAKQRVADLDLGPVADRHRKYIKYALRAAITFGGSIVSGKKPVVGVGNYDALLDPVVEGFVQSVAYNATDQVRKALLQSIAEAEGVVQKANPYHDELGRFATADRAKFVSLWGKPKTTAKEPGPAEKEGRLIVDLPGVDSGVVSRIKAAAEELLAAYPMAGPLKIRDTDSDYSMATAYKEGMLLSTKLWTPERLAQYEKEWEGLAVDPSPEGIVTHEFGHYLAHVAAGPDGKNFKKVRSGMQKIMQEQEEKGNPPSVYGQENDSEYQAESFALAWATRKGKPLTITYYNEDWKNRSIANAERMTQFIEGFLK